MHEYVCTKFLSSTDAHRDEIAQLLYELRRSRNNADYRESFSNLELNATLLVAKAERAISLITTLKPLPPTTSPTS